MALASVAAAKTQYAANLSYRTTGSVGEARLVEEALAFLVVHQPEESQHDKTRHRHAIEVWERELKYVRGWLAANDAADKGGSASSGVVHYSFNDFRI